ncbi:MAG TPA: 4a-hydroxytetrahydrobiopterin dehydratase [Kamptonema sp.]|nr:4a-hydroxytetrahydrobiopterin dehydratase [Kamptonema sp.]
MTQLLSEAQIQEGISKLSGWTLVDRQIQCVRKFKDFVEAIEFVNKLVEPAEAAAHHPDIEISYNKVTINLTTHDAGGLTEKDLALAQQISSLN